MISRLQPEQRTGFVPPKTSPCEPASDADSTQTIKWTD